MNNMKVTYQGEQKTIAQWLAGVQGGRKSLKEQLDTIASNALATHFATRYPGYPVVQRPAHLKQPVQRGTGRPGAAYRQGHRPGRATLGALQLRDLDENIIESRYVRRCPRSAPSTPPAVPP